MSFINRFTCAIDYWFRMNLISNYIEKHVLEEVQRIAIVVECVNLASSASSIGLANKIQVYI